MSGLRATCPAVPVSQGWPLLPGPACSRLCNRGALPLARATGKSAGVREGRGAGKEAAAGRRVGGGREERAGPGAIGRAARRARARGLVACPEAEAAVGARAAASVRRGLLCSGFSSYPS